MGEDYIGRKVQQWIVVPEEEEDEEEEKYKKMINKLQLLMCCAFANDCTGCHETFNFLYTHILPAYTVRFAQGEFYFTILLLCS